MKRKRVAGPLPSPAEQDSPAAVDMQVGSRIRMRRRFLGLSQQVLADALGLTFQQVQKYERGANRVSASKLWEIARCLKVPVSYFFDGLPDPTGDDEAEGQTDRSIHQFLVTDEGLELASLYPKVPRGPLRRRILELVRAAAGEDDDGD